MATRRLGEGERLIRAGQAWKWGMFFLLGSSLQGKTLGVVGMGGIGQATARRAKAFGMDIVYQSRSEIDPGIAAELGARRVDLDELLAVSDVVSLHCPYGPATHHLIGAEQLAAMKSSVYLVNTARGPIVDEAALASALYEGRIAGAGLDVYEREPRVHPELLELENVVLLPHLGSATVRRAPRWRCSPRTTPSPCSAANSRLHRSIRRRRTQKRPQDTQIRVSCGRFRFLGRVRQPAAGNPLTLPAREASPWRHGRAGWPGLLSKLRQSTRHR